MTTSAGDVMGSFRAFAMIGGMSSRLDLKAIELLQTPVPSLPPDEAERLLPEHFGITGTATVLSSERDQNFQILASDGQRYVLKVAHPLEHPQVTDFQTEALQRIAAEDPALTVPRIVTTRAGETSTRIGLRSDQQSTVRLVTYLPGVPLSERTSTPQLRAALRTWLARIDKALAKYSHPGARHKLLWNLTSAVEMTAFISCLPNVEMRSVVGARLSHFEHNVLQELSATRSQVIYNDLNPGNVIVDPQKPGRLVGVIDFGDLVHSFLVVDVAVASAYQLRYTADPFMAVAEFVAAYHRESPLENREIELLFDLIVTRLALAIVITAWRASRHPNNRKYILRNASVNYDLLKRLRHVSCHDIQQRLKTVCRNAEADHIQ